MIHKDAAQKEALFVRWFTQSTLAPLFKPLGMVLLAHHRLELLPDIMQQLIYLYEKNHNIMVFTVESSDPLTPTARAVLERFLTKKTRKTVVTTHSITKKLIAGIRIYSKTLLWEYSIAQQLRQIRNMTRLIKG